MSASNAVGREFAHQPYQRPSLKWYNLPPPLACKHLGGLFGIAACLCKLVNGRSQLDDPMQFHRIGQSTLTKSSQHDRLHWIDR